MHCVGVYGCVCFVCVGVDVLYVWVYVCVLYGCVCVVCVGVGVSVLDGYWYICTLLLRFIRREVLCI